MTSTRKEVYAAIDGERDYQDSKNPRSLPLGEELALLTKYSSKALEVWSNQPFDPSEEEARAVLRKIAGICVRALEHHGAPRRSRPRVKPLAKKRPSVSKTSGSGRKYLHDAH